MNQLQKSSTANWMRKSNGCLDTFISSQSNCLCNRWSYRHCLKHWSIISSMIWTMNHIFYPFHLCKFDVMNRRFFLVHKFQMNFFLQIAIRVENTIWIFDRFNNWIDCHHMYNFLFFSPHMLFHWIMFVNFIFYGWHSKRFDRIDVNQKRIESKWWESTETVSLQNCTGCFRCKRVELWNFSFV